MNEFGVMATIDILAKGMVWHYDDVTAQPVSVIMTKLRMDNVMNEIKEAYMRIKQREAKQP